MKRIQTSYLAYSFFYQLLFWVPIFYEVQRLAGLSEPQIFTIQSWYYFAYFVFEIPTGLLADRIGSRACLLWGGIILTAANALPVVSMEYVPFFVHFLGIGLARSLLSGAGSSWAYTMLEKQGATDQFRVLEGRARAAGLAGRLISWPFAPLMMQADLGMPYALSAIAAALSLVAAWYMPDEKTRSASAPKRRSAIDDMKTLAKSIGTHPLILPVMLQGVGVFVLMRIVLVNLYNPMLTGSMIDIAHFGWIMSCVTGVEALIASMQTKLLKDRSPTDIATFTTLLMAFCVVVMSYLNIYATFAALIGFAAMTGVAGPVQKQFLNDVIDRPELRATILSVESLVDRLVCGIVVLPLGTLVADGRISFALVYAAIAVVSIQLLSHALIRRRMAT